MTTVTNPDLHAEAVLKGRAQKPKGGYIPTLDGWRAIAVFSVIAYHDQVHHFGILSDGLWHDYGMLGVDLFFAISGILICTRLLEEEATSGQISIKGFYIRRFFRILPPAFTYLAVVGLISLGRIITVGLASWFCCLFFVNNYYASGVHNPLSSYTVHFWSLGVEEQFYLLLPVILFFFPRRRILVLTAITIGSLARPIWIFSHPSMWESVGGGLILLRTEMRIHALLLPALIAVLMRQPRFLRICKALASPLIIGPVLAFALAIFAALGVAKMLLLMVPFGFTFLVLSTVLNPMNLFSRFLELSPMRFLGRISYSLYLWQGFFFVLPREDLRAKGTLGMLQSKPWSVPILLLVAIGSYYLLEKPFMRIGHRMAPPPTPGRSDVGLV
jgi:peptidoglycan/LPS O-acetylase OafA/YrhL